MISRYVAVGDSQTEGLNDPDGRGGYRGWADRFADALAVAHPHVQYANLAIRGRLVGEIRTEQVEPALAMRPDLVSVMGGLNDLMRPGCSLAALGDELEAMIEAFRTAGATVLTNTFPDPSAIAPLFRRLAPRVAAHNERIRSVAAAHGALLVDFATHGVGTDLRIWSPDRIHANAVGHSLIAAAFADTIGLAGFDAWTAPLPDAVRRGAARRTAGELRWLGHDVAPWLVRRVRGRSSGDGITAKRPRLVPVAPLFHLVEPADWPAGAAYAPPSLVAEGFVHLSFADQVERTANARFADLPALDVVAVDGVSAGAEIRVEDSYGSGEEFPHVYGPIPAAAVLTRRAMIRGDERQWRLP